LAIHRFHNRQTVLHCIGIPTSSPHGLSSRTMSPATYRRSPLLVEQHRETREGYYVAQAHATILCTPGKRIMRVFKGPGVHMPACAISGLAVHQQIDSRTGDSTWLICFIGKALPWGKYTCRRKEGQASTQSANFFPSGIVVCCHAIFAYGIFLAQASEPDVCVVDRGEACHARNIEDAEMSAEDICRTGVLCCACMVCCVSVSCVEKSARRIYLPFSD
jgi:hypothetical protein